MALPLYTAFGFLNAEGELDGYHAESDLYKALAHPVRLHMLDVLARREACVCHLTALMNKRQPYVSQQLAMLREAGLVVDRREGNLVYYRLRDQRLAGLLSLGRQLAPGKPSDSDASYPHVPEGSVPGCSCPHCDVDGQPVRRESAGAEAV